MKANKKARENLGVTSIVGTLLTLPIALVILTAVMLWANNLLEPVNRLQRNLDEIDIKIDSLTCNVSFNYSI